QAVGMGGSAQTGARRITGCWCANVPAEGAAEGGIRAQSHIAKRILLIGKIVDDSAVRSVDAAAGSRDWFSAKVLAVHIERSPARHGRGPISRAQGGGGAGKQSALRDAHRAGKRIICSIQQK